MAFTENYDLPQRWSHFSFYATGGADGAMVETLAPGKLFQLREVRLHLSVAHPSVEDLVIRVSSIYGSAYNQLLISQAFSDVADYLWKPSPELIFNSDDQIIFSLNIVSGSNVYGLDVKGWGVQG